MSKVLSGKDHIVRERVAELMNATDCSQEEFLRQLSAKADKPLSSTNASLWMTGRRHIPRKYAPFIAEIFGVTQAYLFGRTNDPHSTVEQEEPKGDETFYEIIPAQLYAYEEKPIYVTFGLFEHEDGWAIYNRRRGLFIFAEDTVKEATIKKIGAKLYVRDISDLRDPLIHRKSLDYNGLMNAKNGVYIIMNTSNVAVRKLYNGWYVHNENHTALINNDGLVLPYEGLKKAYNAYTYNNKNTLEID